MSFIETCMDMGLTKEATAELLQRRSAIHAAEQSPAFAEGYAEMQAQMPKSAMIRVRPGYMEKQAMGAAIRTLGKGFGGIARGVGQLGSAAGKGALNVYRKHPKPVRNVLGLAGATGLGAAGMHYMSNRYAAPGVPYMPTGGYNPDQEAKDYRAELDRYSRGIGETNQIIDGARGRMSVLRKAVDSNSPNSAQALKDLRALEAQVAEAQKRKDQHMGQLTSAGEVTGSRLERVQARQQQLRERQQSPFWRGLHWLTFRNPDKSYQAALDELQPDAAELNRQNSLINDQRNRWGYYRGESYEPVDRVQRQREFFPTN